MEAPWLQLDKAVLERILDRNPLTVAPDLPLMEVIALMSQTRSASASFDNEDALTDFYSRGRSSCALVMENQRLLGIFTERDAVKLAAMQRSFHGVKVGEVMTSKDIVTLSLPELKDVFSIIRQLRRYGIRHLPVTDEHNQVVGIVTLSTLRQVLQPNTLLRFRQVKDVMTPRVVHGRPTDSLLTLSQIMAQQQVSCVVIATEIETTDGAALRPDGIVTERDIVQFEALGFDFSELQAEAVMSRPLFLMRPDDSLWKAQQQMEVRHLRRLVVADEAGRLQGIITQSSLLHALDPMEMYSVLDFLQRRVCELEIVQDQGRLLEPVSAIDGPLPACQVNGQESGDEASRSPSNAAANNLWGQTLGNGLASKRGAENAIAIAPSSAPSPSPPSPMEIILSCCYELQQLNQLDGEGQAYLKQIADNARQLQCLLALGWPPHP